MNRLNGLVASTLVVGCVVVCAQAAGAQPPASDKPGPPQAAAASGGRLEGIVTDDAGKPLPGVAVTAQGGRFAYVVSDQEGRFAFEALHPGPYVLRAQMPGYLAARRSFVHVAPSGAAWQRLTLQPAPRATAAFGADGVARSVMTAGFAAADVASADQADPGEDHAVDATAWRLRHLRRSVLREETERAALGEEPTRDSPSDLAATRTTHVPLAAELWSGLPLTGQVQLLTTTSSFDRPDQLFSSTLSRGVAYVAVGAPVGSRAAWSIQGALTQGDVSSWVLGGSYVGRIAAGHRLDAGLTYATQRYVNGNPVALVGVDDGARTVGALFAFDEWRLAPNATLTYGARYARYGYLENPGVLSPSVSLRWGIGRGTWLRGTVERDSLAPGAEEFVPSPVAGMWLPPQRSFSALSPGVAFRAEQSQRLEIAFEREFTAVVFRARGFREDVQDQIVTLFGTRLPGASSARLGHYYTGNAGDMAAFGWGVGLSRPLSSRVRGSVNYTVTHGMWGDLPADTALLALLAPSVLRGPTERVHDVTTIVETDITETATRVYAAYRLSSGFASPSTDTDDPELNARFDVQVAQRLPFLAFTNAQWEVLFAVRNLFRDLEAGSFYDELLVVRPPKRMVGGLLVRF